MFSSVKRLIGSAVFLLAVAAGSVFGAEKLNVGMYVDFGTRGAGVMGWAKILSNSPEINLILIDVDDIRSGKLKDCDVFIMPGGLTGDEYRALGPEGVEIVRKYVADGGSYIGVCAGCGLAMNIKIGLGLVNCGNYLNTDRGQACLLVRINKDGSEMLGVKPGVYGIQYAGGPIPDFTKAVKEWDGKHTILATYDASLGKKYTRKERVTKDGKKTVVVKNFKHTLMYDYPAIVFATYGKGKVLISGPHPEKHEATYPIALGYIHAVTGVKCTYVAPPLGRRPIRVAFLGGAMTGKNAFRALIDLHKSPKLDVYSGAEFGRDGSLDHADVLVLPDGSPKNYKSRYSRESPHYIKRFQDRGGIVIAFGEGVKYLPVHKNSRAVDSWQELKPAIIKCFE